MTKESLYKTLSWQYSLRDTLVFVLFLIPIASPVWVPILGLIRGMAYANQVDWMINLIENITLKYHITLFTMLGVFGVMFMMGLIIMKIKPISIIYHSWITKRKFKNKYYKDPEWNELFPLPKYYNGRRVIYFSDTDCFCLEDDDCATFEFEKSSLKKVDILKLLFSDVTDHPVGLIIQKAREIEQQRQELKNKAMEEFQLFTDLSDHYYEIAPENGSNNKSKKDDIENRRNIIIQSTKEILNCEH